MGKNLTTKEIKERIYSIEGNEYELLSEYLNSKTKIKIKHNLCGYEYEVRWNHFQQGARCPKCSGLMKLTNDEVVQKMYELIDDEYTKLDNVYVNVHIKFKIKHNTCGHEYKVRWSAFQQGSRCPKCNQSKGEKFISDYLTNQHISFTTQVRFDDCRHKKPLPFDFGIIDSNKRIVAVIEYDGKQHFEPIEIWGGEEALEEVQLRDQIKDDYCKEQNLPLLRIKYDEENTLKVIEEFIAQ